MQGVFDHSKQVMEMYLKEVRELCRDAYDKGFKYIVLKNKDNPTISIDNDTMQTWYTIEADCFGVMTLEDARMYFYQGCSVFDCAVEIGIKPQKQENMGLTKETSLKIYNCYQQIEACDKFKKKVVEHIERQKELAEKRDEPIPVNSFTYHGRGCQMGIPDVGSSTASMSIFDISYELALLVIDEHRNTLVQKLEELQRIAVREQSADFSRNARLIKMLSDSRIQWQMKNVSSFYNEKELIVKLADQIGYTLVWACNIYDRTEALNDEAIDRIVQTFDGVSKEWLADGIGEMYKEKS